MSFLFYVEQIFTPSSVTVSTEPVIEEIEDFSSPLAGSSSDQQNLQMADTLSKLSNVRRDNTEDNELSRDLSTSQPQLEVSSSTNQLQLEVSTSNQVNPALSTQSLNNQSYDSVIRNTFGNEWKLGNDNPTESISSENKLRNNSSSHEKIRNDVEDQGETTGASNWRNITRSDESSIHNQTFDAGS